MRGPASASHPLPSSALASFSHLPSPLPPPPPSLLSPTTTPHPPSSSPLLASSPYLLPFPPPSPSTAPHPIPPPSPNPVDPDQTHLLELPLQGKEEDIPMSLETLCPLLRCDCLTRQWHRGWLGRRRSIVIGRYRAASGQCSLGWSDTEIEEGCVGCWSTCSVRVDDLFERLEKVSALSSELHNPAGQIDKGPRATLSTEAGTSRPTL